MRSTRKRDWENEETDSLFMGESPSAARGCVLEGLSGEKPTRVVSDAVNTRDGRKRKIVEGLNLKRTKPAIESEAR